MYPNSHQQQYTASVSSPSYCLNSKNCHAPQTTHLNYTITKCPGTSNPACQQLNLTGNLPSGMAYDMMNPGGTLSVSLPKIPGAIYENGAWGKIDSCDTTANMGGRVHKRLAPNGDLVFTVEGHNHTCAPTINACVNFMSKSTTSPTILNQMF